MSDRFSLAIEFAARLLIAGIALAWFLAIPAGYAVPGGTWTLDATITGIAVAAYAGAHGALLLRLWLGREAGWPFVAAALVDAAGVFGAVASDPAPLPPTLLLAFIAALNIGLRGGWRAFTVAALAIGVATCGALEWRAQGIGVFTGNETDSLLLMMLAGVVVFVLLAWRRDALQKQAALFADQDIETQVLNRRGFDNAARYLVPLHQRTQLPLVIVLASLDTKDAQPLPAATLSAAVRQVGHFVRQRARRSDVVARLSPDEFVLMLFDTPMAGGETLARAVREKFDVWIEKNGIDARVTFGLVNTPEDPVAIDQLIARARSAVQRAQKHPSAPAVVTAPSL